MSKEIKCLAKYEALATPMKRGEYNKFRGWDIPSNENSDDDGFLMQRLDQPSNVEGMKGYVSWLPEKVFNDTYFVVDSDIDRMNIEYEELENNFNKLNEFIKSEKFTTLSGNIQDLMKEQLEIMGNYLDCLGCRMEVELYESEREYLHQMDIDDGYE